MAKDCSFDVVSKPDMAEVGNAIDQTHREIGSRFDFKGSKTDIKLDDTGITIVTDDEMKLKNVIDVIQGKMVKRSVSLKFFEYGKIEPAAGGTVRQVVTLRQGIQKDVSKKMIDAVKAMKLKVQAQYQDDQIRVSGKDKDDLQKVIQMLKSNDFGIELQFVNYR